MRFGGQDEDDLHQNDDGDGDDDKNQKYMVYDGEVEKR